MAKSGSVSGTALTPADAALSKEPVLGNFMVLVAAAMKQLNYNASGVRIAELLEEQLKTSVSNAQVYVALKRMKEAKLIEFVGEAASRNGPPLRTYRLSKDGEQELALKAAHTRHLSSYLEGVLGGGDGRAKSEGEQKSGNSSLGIGASRHGRREKGTPPSGHSGRSRG